MSKAQSPRLNRKRRLLIFAIITAIGVTFALYNALNGFNYAHSKDWNFDSYQNNTTPTDYAPFQLNSPSGLWIVKSDNSAPSQPNVLAATSMVNSSGYHMQIMPDSPTASEAEVTVKFMILPGHHVEQAGLVVRFIDPSHYFVLMADPLNNRISLCKADTQFLVCNYETTAEISTGQWHTLGATLSSEGIGGWFDGNEVIKANTQYYQTGQVGLWTKDDAEAHFDDLLIKY